MEPIDLTPRYSTNDIPGRCIKCMAEEKLFSCMRELFEEEKDTSDPSKGTRSCILSSNLQSCRSYVMKQKDTYRKEKRNKAGHHTAGSQDCQEDHSCHDGRHGMDAASQSKHAGMLANILDNQVLIAGGMGYGAFESLKNSGIEAIITDVAIIDEAVKLYLDGKLVNIMEKLH
jgi:hypothetical protein